MTTRARTDGWRLPLLQMVTHYSVEIPIGSSMMMQWVVSHMETYIHPDCNTERRNIEALQRFWSGIWVISNMHKIPHLLHEQCRRTRSLCFSAVCKVIHTTDSFVGQNRAKTSCIYILTHARLHMHAYTCTLTHVRLHMYAYTCTLTHARLHMHAYTCTLTHVRLHMYNITFKTCCLRHSTCSILMVGSMLAQAFGKPNRASHAHVTLVSYLRHTCVPAM